MRQMLEVGTFSLRGLFIRMGSRAGALVPVLRWQQAEDRRQNVDWDAGGEVAGHRDDGRSAGAADGVCTPFLTSNLAKVENQHTLTTCHAHGCQLSDMPEM